MESTAIAKKKKKKKKKKKTVQVLSRLSHAHVFRLLIPQEGLCSSVGLWACDTSIFFVRMRWIFCLTLGTIVVLRFVYSNFW